MVDVNRAQRIGDQIRKELGRLLLKEIKDERIKLIAITDVQVSRDLSYAKVYYTLVDDALDKTEMEAALKKASGYLRSRIAEELSLRYTPKLRFIYDNAMEYGRHMTQLIDEALAKHPSTDEPSAEDEVWQKND
jgi:ribosome-binding factor A